MDDVEARSRLESFYKGFQTDSNTLSVIYLSEVTIRDIEYVQRL